MKGFETPKHEHLGKNKTEEASFAPEGWVTNKKIAKDLGVSQKTITNIVDPYRSTHTSYFSIFKNQNGNWEHYSPELVNIIINELNSRKNEIPLPGWMNRREIDKEFKISTYSSEQIAEKYKETHPEYFREYRIKQGMGKLVDYYSPELVEIIKNEVGKISPVPEGWETNGALATELKTDPGTVRSIADEYREKYPEYFCEYKNKRNVVCEHYSPEFVEILKGAVKKFKEIPELAEGWNNTFGLSKSLNFDRNKLKDLAESYREDHPEYFKNFKTTAGPIREYYSPELTQILTQEANKFNSITQAPEGWITAFSLAKELDTDIGIVQKITDAYRKDHSKYFENFKIKKGQIREHFSPELVTLVKQKINDLNQIKEALPGWVNTETLRKALRVGHLQIRKIANEYREDHPEYFEFFKPAPPKTGKPAEYYSPELVEIIKNRILGPKNSQSLEELISNEPIAPDGWKMNSDIAREFNSQTSVIKRIVDKYRSGHPEYFKYFKNKKGQGARNWEHYSPEFVEIIRSEMRKIYETPYAPEGWRTLSGIKTELGQFILFEKIVEENRKLHPEYFKEFRDGAGKISEHYSPELVALLNKEAGSIADAPKGWEPNRSMAKKLGIAQGTLTEIANGYRNDHPEYFKLLRNKNYQNRVLEHYSPEFITILIGEAERLTKTPSAPEGWLTRRKIADEMGVGSNSPVISSLVAQYHTSNPEYFKEFRDGTGKISEHYNTDFINIIRKEFEKIPRVIDGWMTRKALSRLSGLHYDKLSKLLDTYYTDHPEYFKEMRPAKGASSEHISPDLIQIILDQLDKTVQAPEGWLTQQGLVNLLEVDKKLIGKLVNKYRADHLEYFVQYKDPTGNIREYYSPEIIKIIKQEIGEIKKNKDLEKQESALQTNFENFVQEVANPDTSDWEAKKIGELLQLLPGNAHDIILKYHPEYKGMKVGYVKKVIADYLGDFMLTKREWRGEDIESFKDIINIKEIHDVVLYNLKHACLTFVNQQRKINPAADEYLLVNEYFQRPEMRRLETSKIIEVRNAMTELREYYDQIFELRRQKPINVVESLKKGRVFPDINQLLNIREMQEKKKMLIADEMGLGKSASAIMTKEYLRLKTALVIIPSNVEDTWENYLSDRVDPETGKQLGYFKLGMTPKVLMINEPKDITRLKNETFDYILISQEKMTGAGYSEALEKVDFDMMIIDEVHKLKNIEGGVRSQAVMKLAEKIEGENKYLTLLSGTPIPNKVQDIAISLKLLYPEKYKKFNNKDIVNRIIYGDLIDLRTEILMRTQMKELATSIEMPPLTEVDVPVDLSLVEREIYEILLEEDELTASEKIILFRQFLLNPELLNMEPGVRGSKIEKLEETLLEDLKTKDKIVVFVNGYVEGVIRGNTNIIKHMNFPDGVIIEEIHGEVNKVERKRIQDELKILGRKTILFVSGQTADVGVDFSGADSVIFYNEPWSKYDKKQQQARVYREGLKNALVSKTLITHNSIEEGIRRYINAKEKAVEKLLKGIQNTDAEKKLLRNDSKLAHNDVETNAELSKEYLSDWEKLMVHFGEGFESGEKQFRKELPTKALEYAQLYKKLGRLTYQGNNARVTATLIENMMNERGESPWDVKILDIASGPEMLKEAAQESLKDSIYSTDINSEHFLQSIKPKNTMAASYLNLPNLDKSVDYCNLGFAFHQTSPIKYYKKNYERLQVLAEMNRVLKPGGRAIISMLHNIKLGDGDKFEKLVNQIGFKLVPNYSGEASGGQNYKAGFFTLEKIKDTPKYLGDAMKFDSADSAKYIRELGDSLGKEFLEGLDMKKTSKGDGRLRDQRRMIDHVFIGGENRKILFNEEDHNLYAQEVQSITEGEALRTKYGGIAEIPIDEIKNIGFERKLETPGYFLLYKIIENGGAVIIRGDYKNKKKK